MIGLYGVVLIETVLWAAVIWAIITSVRDDRVFARRYGLR